MSMAVMMMTVVAHGVNTNARWRFSRFYKQDKWKIEKQIVGVKCVSMLLIELGDGRQLKDYKTYTT